MIAEQNLIFEIFFLGSSTSASLVKIKVAGTAPCFRSTLRHQYGTFSAPAPHRKKSRLRLKRTWKFRLPLRSPGQNLSFWLLKNSLRTAAVPVP